MRILSREEASTLMRLANEYHNGRRSLPPEIIEQKRKIEAAIKNAEAVMSLFNQVDMSLVNDVVQMKLDLDGMYGEWAARETICPT